jgi:uncharacterized protein YbcV (DUF1398 family)
MSNNLKRKKAKQKKRKVNTENMCANLEEEMGLLTICWLQNLGIKIDFLNILNEIG